MQWQGRMYVDTCLSFGLRSAPIIFIAVADSLEWVVKARGVRALRHYLDDFITVGAPSTGECQANMTCLSHTCEQLGVPLAPHKSEGPATCLKFLGIEIDTMSMELWLPEDKLLRVKETVKGWLQKESGRKSSWSGCSSMPQKW